MLNLGQLSFPQCVTPCAICRLLQRWVLRRCRRNAKTRQDDPCSGCSRQELVLFVFNCAWGKQLALCTGEVAEQVNPDTSELIANGERLSAIK